MMKNGVEPKRSYEKMSKSKYNGVDPTVCIAKHGADCIRAHILYSAPVPDVLEWNEESIVGMERWLNRVWRLLHSSLRNSQAPPPDDKHIIKVMNDVEKQFWRTVQETVVSVTNALSETYSLNTMISDLIKLTNSLEKALSYPKGSIRPNAQRLYVETLVKLIAPTAPAFADECWKAILESKKVNSPLSTIFDTAWPEVDDAIFEIADVKCAVQVDGKTRFVVDIPGTVVDNTDQIAKLVVGTPDGNTWLANRLANSEPQRIVVAPGGRVINFVFKTARKAKVET
jgi:leucyl-tRNA synthetase